MIWGSTGGVPDLGGGCAWCIVQGITPTVLFSNNKKVDIINAARFEELPGDPVRGG